MYVYMYICINSTNRLTSWSVRGKDEAISAVCVCMSAEFCVHVDLCGWPYVYIYIHVLHVSVHVCVYMYMLSLAMAGHEDMEPWQPHHCWTTGFGKS